MPSVFSALRLIELPELGIGRSVLGKYIARAVCKRQRISNQRQFAVISKCSTVERAEQSTQEIKWKKNERDRHRRCRWYVVWSVNSSYYFG